MDRPSRSVVLFTAIALAIGIVEPSLEVAWKCRAGFETSEACVWGRSYLPLGRAIGLVVIAPLALGALLVVRWVWHDWVRRSRPSV
jgi:hypothetical protein